MKGNTSINWDTPTIESVSGLITFVGIVTNVDREFPDYIPFINYRDTLDLYYHDGQQVAGSIWDAGMGLWKKNTYINITPVWNKSIT